MIVNFSFRSLDYTTNLDHGSYFYLGAIKLHGRTKHGPGGKGILRLLVEILQFISTPGLRQVCEILIKEFRKQIKGLHYTSFVGVTPQFLLNGMGGSFLKKILKMLPSKYQKKIKQGPRTLIVFPDGMMKNRYIALLDWLSQGTLAPLHHGIIQILKRFSDNTDYTFDQGASITTCIKIYHEGKQA